MCRLFYARKKWFRLPTKLTFLVSLIICLVLGSCSTTLIANTSRRNGNADTVTIAKRDKFLWPFSSSSPWNMPIGSGARYQPANIKQAHYATGDEEYFFKLKADNPLQPLYAPGSWGPGRCTGTRSQGISLPLPDALLVPDATTTKTPNNAAAFLLPDGKTLVQVNELARCTLAGPIFGWRAPEQSIYGDGLRGGHGGSGLSSIGGSIRKGELTGSEPIRHVLKVNLWAQKYLYYSKSIPGYRWPADRADSYAAGQYKGTNPNLVMGTLLAIPPTVTEADLGLQTPAGRKLFHALQDYGAYVVDDSAADTHAFAVEQGVFEEFRTSFGYDFYGTSGNFYNDFMKLFQALHIVYNNGPNNLGGGGRHRDPLAPPIL